MKGWAYRLTGQARRQPLFTGMLLVVLANLPLLTTRWTVKWDAFDEMWTYFRWMGAALRAGHFPDFFPNLVTGYPLGANMQAGVYNLFYLVVAALLPDSVLSINLLYLALQIAIFGLTWLIASTSPLQPLSRLYLALAVTASGFVVGHASHLSYLSTACGLLACLLSLRWLVEDRRGLAFLAMVLGVYHLFSAGYPANILFGAQCLALYWVVLLQQHRAVRAHAWVPPVAVFIGLLLASPALWHLLNQLQHSDRGQGVSLQTLEAGAMQPYSLLNYLAPWWPMRKSEPTMERFHLLWVSAPLTAYALWHALVRGYARRDVLLLAAAAGLMIVLALGPFSPLPVRSWLAESSLLYRTGRFPAGEHRGVALFLLAWLSAIGLDLFLARHPHRVRLVAGLLMIEFVLGLYVLKGTRFGSTPPAQRGSVERIQVVFGGADQERIDTARDCSPAGPQWAIPALRFQLDRLAPAGFSWHGYTNLKDRVWVQEHESVAPWLCTGPRLWDVQASRPQPYRLQIYAPGSIRFQVQGEAGAEPRLLVWADYTDGFWRVRVNGQEQDIVPVPARLRGFHARPGDHIELTYRGPLSRLWRR